MRLPCETCVYMTIANDGLKTVYCASPKRKFITLRKEREQGNCTPAGLNWKRNYEL